MRLTSFKTTVNLSPKSIDPTFGQSGADASVWSKVASLISSVRMVVRCTFGPQNHPFVATPPPPFPTTAVWAQDPYVERRADTKTRTPPTVPLIFVNAVIIVYELILG